MRYLLFLLLLIPFVGFAQLTETNSPVTKDTTYTDGGGTWLVRMTHQRDGGVRPTWWMMPGQGQNGSTDTNNLTAYGYHYWLQHGWDGHVTISNGTHYPNFITVSYTNNVFPYPSQYVSMMTWFMAHYSWIEAGSNTISGFSQGAFTQGGIIEYEKVLGDHFGMSLIKAALIFEGEPTTPANEFPARAMNCSGAHCDTNYYKTWAQAPYNGRYFYLEGSGSDNFRDGWHYAAAMNNTVPKSAYFSYETLGGGAHCCWNQMWDPSVTNWSCVAPLGPNNGGSELGTNQMGNYIVGDNVFQWLYRNGGDTSIHGTSVLPPTSNAGGPYNITSPLTTATLVGTGTPGTGATSVTYLWSQLTGSASTIGTPTSATTNLSGLSTGSYTYNLKVTDNLGAIANSTASVVVSSSTCRIFYWDSTSTNINLTNVNLSAFPLIHRCDIIYILNRKTGGGYRTFSMSGIGAINDAGTGMIRVVWLNGAKIAPSTSNIFGNTMDSCNYVEIDSFVMDNHPDMCMLNYGSTGYSHHIYWHGGSNQNGSGFLGNGGYSSTLSAWNKDSVNCFYDWHWDNFTFSNTPNQTIGGGGTALWIGSGFKNQVWMKLEIGPNVKFDNYSSVSQPASYIHMQNCMYCLIHDDTISRLAQNYPHPTGHAASIFLQADLTYIYNNYFGPDNFGNDVRSIGQGDTPPLDSWFSTWEHQYFGAGSTFDGTSRFYNNVSIFKRKYPVYETQNDPADTTFNPWYLPRSSPWLINNTCYSLAIGAVGGRSSYSNNYYSASLGDIYTRDTVRARNNVFAVLGDSSSAAWAMHNSQATVALFSLPLGSVTYYDTASNRFIQFFANAGFQDSVNFIPTNSGPLYNAGVAPPFLITFDKNGQPRKDPTRTPGYEIGAYQFINPVKSNCGCLNFVLPTSVPKQ